MTQLTKETQDRLNNDYSLPSDGDLSYADALRFVLEKRKERDTTSPAPSVAKEGNIDRDEIVIFENVPVDVDLYQDFGAVADMEGAQEIFEQENLTFRRVTLVGTMEAKHEGLVVPAYDPAGRLTTEAFLAALLAKKAESEPVSDDWYEELEERYQAEYWKTATADLRLTQTESETAYGKWVNWTDLKYPGEPIEPIDRATLDELLETRA
jgi:hypothetical protein